MNKLGHFDCEPLELTAEELALVTGGAEPTNNKKSPLAGARTEVKDSHDRYANIEVSYLR